jgi:hypothetical protein
MPFPIRKTTKKSLRSTSVNTGLLTSVSVVPSYHRSRVESQQLIVWPRTQPDHPPQWTGSLRHPVGHTICTLPAPKHFPLLRRWFPLTLSFSHKTPFAYKMPFSCKRSFSYGVVFPLKAVPLATCCFPVKSPFTSPHAWCTHCFPRYIVPTRILLPQEIVST